MSQKISFFNEESGVHTGNRRSLLDDYLLNPKLDLADVVGMACDILMTGIDTVWKNHRNLSKKHFNHFFSFFHQQTTYSTCFLLYHLARNPHVQEKVFQEAITVLPNIESDEITAEQMANQLTYSKAVLKETFRLNPVSVGVGRITNTDLILNGYNVPKGVISESTFFYLNF